MRIKPSNGSSKTQMALPPTFTLTDSRESTEREPERDCELIMTSETSDSNPFPAWKERQRALAKRARMGRVVKPDVTNWLSNGASYEKLPNGQIVNLDKRARRAAREEGGK